MAGIAAAWAGQAWAAEKINFSRQIKPILSNNCFRCHGPDPGERKGGSDGLRLDVADGAKADLGGYAAVVPGHPETSALVKRINSSDADERMPPADSGKKLSPAEIELLTEWIRQGAEYSQHWAYVKPVLPALPAVKDDLWVRNPIDRFVLARLEREGLHPAVEADRYALARRVSLDLTGLPPTLEEVDAFVADADPAAYEKMVDRLLAKPAYGEHWAQQWLDMARYADSAGYADDPPRTIWLYRDYVIRSFNANKPLDQFTVEQIAGDMLPNPSEEQLIATAFHRNTLTNSEGGTDDEEFRNVAIVDRVNTTMAIWMATTMACAQCHNHKFDPITQQEYFRLFALFNETEDSDKRDEQPLLSVYTEPQIEQRALWQNELAATGEKLKAKATELAPERDRWLQNVPLEVAWQTLVPTAARSREGKTTTISSDGIVGVEGPSKTDVYQIEIAAAGSQLLDPAAGSFGRPEAAGQGTRLRGRQFRDHPFRLAAAPPRRAIAGRPIRADRAAGQGKDGVVGRGRGAARGGQRGPAGSSDAKQHRLRRQPGIGDRRQHQRRLQRSPFDHAHRRFGQSVVGSRFENRHAD